jgi:hypothetical protein
VEVTTVDDYVTAAAMERVASTSSVEGMTTATMKRVASTTTVHVAAASAMTAEAGCLHRRRRHRYSRHRSQRQKLGKKIWDIHERLLSTVYLTGRL